MKERPILFSGSMVRAILEGRKTQTRRIIKPQPDMVLNWDDVRLKVWHEGKKGYAVCPYGKPEDRLWVRETWAKDIPGCPNGVTYRADHLDPLGDGPAKPITWKPSIHMPRIASRITLEIIRVRVEKLQSISEEDAKAEGVVNYDDRKWVTYALQFSRLWDSINSKRAPWSSNPWVWVVEFKRVAPC